MASSDQESNSLVSGLQWRWDTDYTISEVLDNQALPLLARVRRQDPDIPLSEGDVLLLHSSYASHKVLAQCMDRQGGRVVGPMFNIGYNYPGTFEVLHGEGRVFESVQEILTAVEANPARVFKVLAEDDVVLSDKEKVPKSVAHNLGMYGDRKHLCRKGDILLPEGKAVRLAENKGMGRLASFGSAKEWKRTLLKKKERSKSEEEERVHEYLVCSNQAGEILYLPAKHRATFTSIKATSGDQAHVQVKDIADKMKLPVDVKLLRGEIPKGDFRTTPFLRLHEVYKESVVLASLVAGDKVKAAMELSTSALLRLSLADTSSREYAELLIRLHTQNNVLPKHSGYDKRVSVAASTSPTGKSTPTDETVDTEQNMSPTAFSTFQPHIYSPSPPSSPSNEESPTHQTIPPTPHQTSPPVPNRNKSSLLRKEGISSGSLYQKLKLSSLMKRKSRARSDSNAAADDAVNVYKEAMEAIDSLQTVSGQENKGMEAVDDTVVEEASLSFFGEEASTTKDTSLKDSEDLWEKFGEDYDWSTPASNTGTEGVAVIPSPRPQTVDKPKRPPPPVPVTGPVAKGLQNINLKENSASDSPVEEDAGWVSLRTSSGGHRNSNKTRPSRPPGPPPPPPVQHGHGMDPAQAPGRSPPPVPERRT